MKSITSSLGVRRLEQILTASRETTVEDLIQRGARALADAIPPHSAHICIVCGSGSNGRYGLALACLLVEQQTPVTVYYRSTPPQSLSNTYIKRLEEYQQDSQHGAYLTMHLLTASYLKPCDVLVDCLLGCETRDTSRGFLAKVIQNINDLDAFIISCDIPSGLDANTGIGTTAVHADVTVAMQIAKLGHVLADGKDCTGELRIANEIVASPFDNYMWWELSDLRDFFYPRPYNFDKWQAGVTAIMGGSLNFVGAPLIASGGEAALRVGAGLSRLIIPDSLGEAVRSRVTNSTIAYLPTQEGATVFDENALVTATRGVTALAVGMGMGRGTATDSIVHYLLQHFEGTLIIDADALGAVVGHEELLQARCYPTILTPHTREFARLSGITEEELLSAPLTHAIAYASAHHVVLLLKGAATIVTDGREVAVVSSGDSTLSKGGSGDLLSGLIVGFAGRGIDELFSATAASVLLAEAGQRAGARVGMYSALTDDIMCDLREVLAELQKG